MHLPNLDGVRLLVTGTGHCGTEWAAKVLKAAGQVVAHEGIFQHDPLPRTEWQANYTADVSCRAAPHLPELPESITVVHLIRRPIDVVRSMYYSCEHGWMWAGRPYIEKILGKEIKTDDPLVWICEAVIAWREMISSSGRVSQVVRAEDGSEALCRACAIPAIVAIPAVGARKSADAPPLCYRDIPNTKTALRLWALERSHYQ